MTFLVRMLKFLFWFLVLSWTAAMLRHIVGKMASGGQSRDSHMDVPNDAVNQKLVRDPVCGMHLAEALALRLEQGRETVHFCSAECREKYRNGERKLSASA